MLNFKPITSGDKPLYEPFLHALTDRGCELTFSNLCLWGHQQATIYEDHMVLLSQFYGHYMYPYPVGAGDKKVIIDAIMTDAKERQIPLRLTSLNAEAKETLENLYPGKFRFYYNPDSFDYIYDINDLADLAGRKYHKKRNHYKRFQKNFSDYTAEPLSDAILPKVKDFCTAWYADRLAENPEEDFDLEQTALMKLLSAEDSAHNYKALGMEGMVLLSGDKILAFTIGSQMTADTFDVQFEKALAGADGAYAAINCEFAGYIRQKYPHIKFLDREEDMGNPGLRKAKQSYYPHHQIEKYHALFLEN